MYPIDIYIYILIIIYIFVRWMEVLAEGAEAPTACQQSKLNKRTKVMRLHIQPILRAWERRMRRRKGLGTSTVK